MVLSPAPPGWRNKVVYVWTTIASRRTGTFMKLKGNLYEILDETPGEFGLAAYSRTSIGSA